MNVDFLCSIKSSDQNISPSYRVISGLSTNNLHIVSDNTWWFVITDWREDHWAFTAPTQLISDMIKGDSPNQLLAKFLQLWKGKMPIWSNARSGWLMFSTCGTAQEFIIQIIFFRKYFPSYIGEISNYSQQMTECLRRYIYEKFCHVTKDLLWERGFYLS